MDREGTPADWLSGFFGVDITDSKKLRDLFARMAADHKRMPRAAYRLMTTEIYARYVRLYELSCILVSALREVLEDAEHQLVMEEARALGYKLPDFDSMLCALEAYRAFLDENDPNDALPGHRPGYVRLRPEAVDIFFSLAEHNCFMVARIFDGCFNTEYMKHFGFLNHHGYKYLGATALQETLDVLMAMLVLKNRIDRLQKSPGDGKPPEPKP